MLVKVEIRERYGAPPVRVIEKKQVHLYRSMRLGPYSDTHPGTPKVYTGVLPGYPQSTDFEATY